MAIRPLFPGRIGIWKCWLSALQSVWFIYTESDVWHVHFYHKRFGNETYSEQFICTSCGPCIQKFREYPPSPPPPRQSPAPIPKIFFAVSLLVLELSLKQTKILRVKEIAGLQIFSISAGHKRKITYSATPGQLNTIRV